MLAAPSPRLLVAVATAAAVGAGWPAEAQSRDGALRIEHAGGDTLAVAAGERGSIAFRLVNEGRSVVTGRIEIEAPAGWRLAAPATGLELPAGSSAIRVVSFYPATDAVGVHSLALTVRSPGGASASDRVHVRVPERAELKVEVEDAPRWAAAGEPYTVRARVENAGNVRSLVAIALESPYGIPAETDTTARWIEPRQSSSVVVRVSPPSEMERSLVHTLKVRAVSAADTASAVARVEIIPGGRTRAPARVGVPAELRVRASVDPRAGPPLRFHAAGPLRPGSRTRVELLLQGPSETYSMFGETDVYRFGLDTPHLSLDLGDNVFRLSRLTEPGREGFGAGGEVRAGPLSAGGFARYDRRSFRPDSQYAAFAALSAGRLLSLRGNWLRTDHHEGRREVMTGEGRLYLPGLLTLRGEIGARPVTGSTARMAELLAQRGPFTLGLRHLSGDTAYGGVHAGLSNESAHLNVRPWRALYVEGSLERHSSERPHGSTSIVSAQRSARVAAGWGSHLTAEGRELERVSRSGGTVTHQLRSRSGRLRLGIPIGPLTLHPAAEIGVIETGDSVASRPFWRAGARTSLRTGPATFSSNLEYFTGGTLHRSIAEEGLAASVAAALRFAATELRVSAHGTRYIAPLERENLIIDGSVTQELPFGHLLSARVMRRTSTGLFRQDDAIAMLDYTIPLRLPTGRAGSGAAVTVRVRDAETGADLPRVVLNVAGRRIATGRDGRAVIRGLEQGVHYIDLDRTTAGAGRIPSVPMPMRIEIGPGGRRTVEIEMLPPAGLTVRTRIARAASVSGRAAPDVAAPLERVTLDFHHGAERIRRQTASDGTVELGNLRPGTWTIRVVGAPLPSFHRFDSDSVTVELLPGGHADVSFTAAPIARRMEIVATADLTDPTVASSSGTAAPEVARDTVARVAVAPAPPARPRAPTVPLGEPVAEPDIARTAAPPRAADRPVAEPPDAETAPEGFTITVVAGDRSLRSIAAMVYGDRDLWPRIYVANRDVLSHPDRIFPGQVLRIPPAGPLTAEERAIARRFPDSR